MNIFGLSFEYIEGSFVYPGVLAATPTKVNISPVFKYWKRF